MAAEGYSIHNIEFGSSIFLLIISLIIFYVIIAYPLRPESIMIILTGGLIFFGFLALFGFALRDISRQKNWVLREYPTNLELCREKDKDNILKTIRNVLRSADLEVVEVPYKGRFPVELIKSYRVNDKIQIDICSKYSQKEFHAILPNKYQYFLVIFLGPVNEKNKALSNRIRHELDKTFL